MTTTEAVDWSECPGIEVDPNRQSGAPVFAGTRIPVDVVTNNIERGGTHDEIEKILDNFPVTREQVETVLNFLRPPAGPGAGQTVNVLFDVNTPRKLRGSLRKHEVRTAQEQGWDTLTNGELLRVAETAGFEVMVTADRNLADHQQNLTTRRIALVVLSTNRWSVVRQHAEAIASAIDAATAGSFKVIEMPRGLKPPNGLETAGQGPEESGPID